MKNTPQKIFKTLSFLCLGALLCGDSVAIPHKKQKKEKELASNQNTVVKKTSTVAPTPFSNKELNPSNKQKDCLNLDKSPSVAPNTIKFGLSRLERQEAQEIQDLKNKKKTGSISKNKYKKKLRAIKESYEGKKAFISCIPSLLKLKENGNSDQQLSKISTELLGFMREVPKKLQDQLNGNPSKEKREKFKKNSEEFFETLLDIKEDEKPSEPSKQLPKKELENCKMIGSNDFGGENLAMIATQDNGDTEWKQACELITLLRIKCKECLAEKRDTSDIVATTFQDALTKRILGKAQVAAQKGNKEAIQFVENCYNPQKKGINNAIVDIE